MDRLLGTLMFTFVGAVVSGCGDPLLILGDAPGVVRIVAGRPGEAGDSIGALARESLLNSPHGLTAGSDGTVYIADRENRRILALTSAGGLDVLLDHSRRLEEPRLRSPHGLALDAEGGLLIADPVGQRLWRLDLAQRTLAPLAGSGAAGFGPDTAPALQAPLREPVGVAVAPDGRVYFSEFGAERVRRLEPGGTLVTIGGSGTAGFSGDGGPAAEAGLWGPAGLHITGDVLYVADSRNQRVRAIDLRDGLIRTVAGAGDAGFSGDGGPAEAALLDEPVALAASADGSVLFIADLNNHRVRAVNLNAGTISTLMGTGDEAFRGDLLLASETALSVPQGLATTPFNLLFIADTGHHIVLRTAIGFPE